MSIPFSESIGKARWTQGSDDDRSLEVRIPIALPEGVRSRDLHVEIKDLTILIVGHGNTRMIQWRLYAPVSTEVEWRVEESMLILDMGKSTASTWSCLIDLPMRDNDELFISQDDIDKMFAAQLPQLPPLEEMPTAEKNGEAESKENKEEDDLDKLLEEAADEAVARDNEEPEEVGYAAFTKAELANYESESKEIVEKLQEVEAQLVNPTDNEKTKSAQEQKEILEEMLRLHNRFRELRSQPSSLGNFLLSVQVEVQKGRTNIGQLNSEETEEFESEGERNLSATELMTCGLKFYEDEDLKGCFHFLRLAALHHKHDQSILLLYSIYAQLGNPRGASILLKRALDKENPSAMVLQRVGELFDEGARYFLPLFPAALHFYQCAAKLGSVNAMLSLAQLWLRGSTSTSMLQDEQAEAQKSIARYHAWIQKAMDRGCGSAFFVKGCMHLKGEHGMSKSYADARENLDAATSAQPEIIRRAPQILQMLEALRKEEQGNVTEAPKEQGTVAVKANLDDAVKVTPSSTRLSALGAGGSGFGNAQRAKKSFGASAKRRAFWERTCITSLVVYGVYALAFPIRILMLPYFYAFVSSITDVIPWLGNGNAADITF